MATIPAVGAPSDATPVASLRTLLERQAAIHGDRPAVRLPDGQLTYRDVDELANRMAAVLLDQGVRPGDVVAVLCRNGMAMLAAWFGCAKAGAVFMPVNPLLGGEPLRSVVAHARAATAVVEASLLPELGAVVGGLPHLRRILVAGPSDRVEVGTVPTLPLDLLLDAAPSSAPDQLSGDPGAPAKLMYTSGTTGVPKGVLWSRVCEATWGSAYGDELVPVEPGEGVYCCLPLSHVTCQGTTLATLWRGGCITIDSGFDAFGFWNRVREADAKVFTFVGTILAVLARRRPLADDADNPVGRILGAAAPAELWREIEDRFQLTIVDVWGQTETASCWTMPVALPQRPGTVGRPTDRFETRLSALDGDGDVLPGRPGELWIRPTRPHVMFEGYLTAEGLDRSAWTEDGWYRTGDLMAIDEDGDHTYVGRIREAIRRRGEMIAAGDVEAAARAHDDVAEAAAVGVPADDGVEQEIKLCIVPQADVVLDPAALHDHLRKHLPRFMVPRYVEVRADLPKTPSTRVRKFALEAEGTASAWDSRHPDRLPGPPPTRTPKEPRPHD